MSRFRCYVQPFDYNGNYTGQWNDVTDDVDLDQMGNISRQVDANNFDVGIFKYAQVNLVFLNSKGRYSGPDVFQSIFKTKIANSLFKVTWDVNDYYCKAGVARTGEKFKPFLETEIFRGFINDVPGQQDIDTQKVQYQVLGLESLFENTINPGTLLNTDIFSALIYKCLNQLDITQVMTLDPLNINTGLDGYTVDDVSQYDGKTVKEILDELLLISNSVLYVNNGIIYVVPRNIGGASQATFFGQASNFGIEDILNIQNFNNGASKMFNYFTWDQSTVIVQDETSITLNGYSKKKIEGISAILPTSTATITAILTALKNQYRFLKQQFDLVVPIRPTHVPRYLMDHITVDYPTVLIPAENTDVPLYGHAIYGADKYPLGQWQLTIPSTDDYQIIGWEVDTKAQNFIFTVKKYN